MSASNDQKVEIMSKSAATLGSAPFMSACILAALLSGCARPNDVIAQRGDMLVKAGFDARSANTSERQEMLGRLPPNRFLHSSGYGRALYLYADLENCRCLYVGSQQAYDGFKQQMVQLHLSSDDQMKADVLIADWTASANRWEASGH